MATLAVDTKHPLYMRNLAAYEMVVDCVMGETAVKYRKERYLPHPNPHDVESKDPKTRAAAIRRYQAYLTRARFLNATGRTLFGMLGVVFGKPVTIKLAGQLTELETNADGKGQPLTQLMRDMVSETLKSGRGYLLPDFTGSGEQTITTQGQAMLRFFSATQIINWRESNNKTTLVVFQYTENIDDANEFQNRERTVWLELRMIEGVAHARRWTQDTGGSMYLASNSTQTPLVPMRDMSGQPLTEIPGCWLGAENNDAEPDAAPLADIASLNIGHYQADADVVEAARLVGMPTLVISGLTQAWADKYLKNGCYVGSTQGILLNETASAQILQAQETNASTNLKEQRTKEMAQLGAKLIERGTAARTATQASYEAETDNSVLSLAAGNVEQCMNKALKDMALMINGNGEVQINQRYDIATVDAPVLTALMGMVQNGALSLHNFIRYQQSIGLVSADQKVEEIESEIRDQPPLPGLELLPSDPGNGSTPPDNGNQGGA